jgi:benzoyl-CoA reductase/2-hydroxyglutaryl-CoA dehydratase subunit BcrC/BadD/HgdB
MCGWIKGLYVVADHVEDLEAIIAVMQGDCSNTQALLETLVLKGHHLLPFAYPYDRDYGMMKSQMDHLMASFDIAWEEVNRVRESLEHARRLLAELDRMTWEDNLVTGEENHIWLVSSSDFNGDPNRFTSDLTTFIAQCRERKPLGEEVRLAYIGVPPIFTDLYSTVEGLGGRVVFNEVQRQFAMPVRRGDIVEQYIDYTYPYGAFARIEDILQEAASRKVDGIIHYTQSFCFRQIEDIIFRQRLELPVLTLEGDRPGRLDARSRMRLEAFIDMLR